MGIRDVRFMARAGVIVIYFFAKDSHFIQYEIYPGRPHVLRIIGVDGHEQTERYGTSADLRVRLHDLHADLRSDGWSGPLGRDARA
jgi:hypothetical protein